MSNYTKSQAPLEQLAGQLDDVVSGDTALSGPPVDQWDPPDRGQLAMRITRDGQWHYEGKPLTRPALVKLFASILRRDSGDDYCLVTPVEKFHIQVDDVPFVAHTLEVQSPGPDQVLWLTTSSQDRLALGPDHPLSVQQDTQTGEPAPYVRVRRNLYARLERSAYYHLVELAQEREQGGERHLGVTSYGEFFSLGAL
ncbi:MAG: DUF1285 domain-containing protein [Halomonadaceae bacterium]|nr:MAG: DUF1285 domain-containing protein [Halomonadaceae bacterium]